MIRPLDAIQRSNSAYIEEMYARFRSDPGSVPADWAAFFAGVEFGGAAPSGGKPGGAFSLTLAYREVGHTAARIDPLNTEPGSHRLLELSAHGLSEADLGTPLTESPFRGDAGATLGDLVAALRETYCGTLGVEYMDVPFEERRTWLEERMESVRNRPVLSTEDRLAILESLIATEAFEQFLHVKYPGQKRFSIEGGCTLLPMLHSVVEESAAAGATQIAIGMPHRGRLNVLAHIMHKPLERIFNEFESSFAPEDVQGHGDVKYHLGYSSDRRTRSGARVHLDLEFNPSHLEFVDPVVLGAMRARQDIAGDTERAHGVPVLIHGDAAFAGEGVVPETLSLAQLPGYRTGGTLHLVINNQVGFTTPPDAARATPYATDAARIIQAPVFHVNGDDPEKAVHAVRLALEYRARFKADAFVDLVCYRLHGHNELDDPTFTQPVMYRQIAGHARVSKLYSERLRAEGVLDDATLAAMQERVQSRLQEAHQRARREEAAPAPVLVGAWEGMEWAGEDWSARTAVAADVLERIADAPGRAPEGFHVHRKVARLLAERRKQMVQDRVDWGMAEALALGSLLLEGFHVRLSGQDTGRGTFSHRHAVLHDEENGALHVPLQHLAPEQGRFEIYDTMLSEAAVLGFEYGFSMADPRSLVIWEAQFGDFANVAQVAIDQFVASAESKWNRMSGITLLLPHGYEGQGPEHSSARLERFLELCADGNIQVCNLTTPAQYFHALRRQMHRKFRKPLVIMSPKSLLRHPQAVSVRREFSAGGFHNLIGDSAVEPAAVRTLILVSGRFYYPLVEARGSRNVKDIAIVRCEQLYPFPRAELVEQVAALPNLREIRWVQEEPANMGGWRHLRHRIEGAVQHRTPVRLVARKAASTPATGYYQKHVEQEKELLDRALSAPASDLRTSVRPGAHAPQRVAG
jgi:2-oxoglutarate dehydrogenase E1 component